MRLFSDITELENAQENLRVQVLHDSLTGLPNRRYFIEHLDELITLDRSHTKEIYVCFIDLDDFKHVNDTAGHNTGDALLCGLWVKESAPW
ncbi:MAG: GGDEF domain-containing protein [Planctomycetaceae bacterium]